MTGSIPRDEQRSASPGFNLLRIGPIRAVMLSPLFPYVVQIAVLGLLIWLAWVGWGLFAPEGVPSKQFAKTNLVNLLIWGIWWPAMVWLAVLFGRVWCAVCPLELVANLTERVGRGAGLPQRTLGRWLRAGFLILVLYAVIQLLVAGAELHRVPAYTSVFLLVLLGLAAVVGLLYRDRAFCRGFCPVGLLLATYGRGSMLAVRPEQKQTCQDCPGHDCLQACNRTRLDARSCPSLLNPSKLKENSDCLVCGQCMKACPPSNMGLYLRRPFHPNDARERIASWSVTLFVMLVSGFVAYELFSEWKAAKAVFLWVPQTVAELGGLAPYEGWIKGIWMLGVVPLAVWSVLGGLVLLFRGAANLGDAWRRLALPLTVIVAAGHMAKGLAKLVSWGGYLPSALQAPTGTDAAVAITAGAMDKPAALLPLPIVSEVSLILLAAMAYFGVRESRLADPATHKSRVPSLVLATAASGFLIYGWGFLQ
jgi:polyferredoxin